MALENSFLERENNKNLYFWKSGKPKFTFPKRITIIILCLLIYSNIFLFLIKFFKEKFSISIHLLYKLHYLQNFTSLEVSYK